MDEKIGILVRGAGPLASATARRLFLAGHAVALHGRETPKILRRKMSFADAWSRGDATLDGVVARRVRNDSEFVAGLRGKSYIPVLTKTRAAAAERWPWDAIVVTGNEDGGGEAFDADARLRIGLGAGFVAGEDCDLVIATEGPDPGAVIRRGAVRGRTATPGDRSLEQRGRVAAPGAGLFTPEREIGELVGAGDTLGFVDGTAIRSKHAGRLIGLLPAGAVAGGEPVAEVTLRLSAPFSGVSKADQALARAVLFAIEIELNGWTPTQGFA